MFDEKVTKGRVNFPSEVDDAALKEFGRQLAMDSLLEDLVGDEVMQSKRFLWGRRAVLGGMAASLVGGVGWFLYRGGGGQGGGDGGILLHSSWVMVATQDTDFDECDSCPVEEGGIIF